MRRDEVRVDREPQDPQSLVEIVLPDGRVPVGRAALQHFGAPDVVDEHVDVAVVVPDPRRPGSAPGPDRDGRPRPRCRCRRGAPTNSAVSSIVSTRSYSDRRDRRAATGADDRRAGFAQGRGDAAPGTSGGTGNDRDPTTKRVPVRRPSHMAGLMLAALDLSIATKMTKNRGGFATGSIPSLHDRCRGVRRSELSVGVDHVSMDQGGGAATGSRRDVAVVLPRDPRRLRRGADHAGGPPGDRDRGPRPLAPDAADLRGGPGALRRRGGRRASHAPGDARFFVTRLGPRRHGARRRASRRVGARCRSRRGGRRREVGRADPRVDGGRVRVRRTEDPDADDRRARRSTPRLQGSGDGAGPDRRGRSPALGRDRGDLPRARASSRSPGPAPTRRASRTDHMAAHDRVGQTLG